MPSILVTGSTGFVGRHVVAELVAQGYTVSALVRDTSKLSGLSWCNDVNIIEGTLENSGSVSMQRHDVLMHLAWDGLPNYQNLFHIEQNFPQSYNFIRQQISTGTSKILVLGTCLEYGLVEGELSACRKTDPQNAYAVAKDTLHKHLRELAKQNHFSLLWARLFYIYGPGQNAKSFLPQLAAALKRGDPEFRMSGGEQLRDYLPVEDAATQIVELLESPQSGAFNICSGQPISMRRFAEQYIQSQDGHIELNLGHFPYLDFEPMSFWGKK